MEKNSANIPSDRYFTVIQGQSIGQDRYADSLAISLQSIVGNSAIQARLKCCFLSFWTLSVETLEI